MLPSALAAVSTLVLALAACAADTGDDPMAANAGRSLAAAGAAQAGGSGPIVLTWAAPAGGAFHAVGAEGTLVQEQGCLFLRTGADRLLLVFPEGTRWDGAAGGLRFGNQLLRLGSRISLSGNSPSGPEGVAPGFDTRGCAAGTIFRVNPWAAR
jgi:hypothetical protein